MFLEKYMEISYRSHNKYIKPNRVTLVPCPELRPQSRCFESPKMAFTAWILWIFPPSPFDHRLTNWTHAKAKSHTYWLPVVLSEHCLAVWSTPRKCLDPLISQHLTCNWGDTSGHAWRICTYIVLWESQTPLVAWNPALPGGPINFLINSLTWSL